MENGLPFAQRQKNAAPNSPGNYRYRPLQDAPGDYVKTPCPPIN